MSKTNLLIIIIFTLFAIISPEPSCTEGQNNCEKCHPLNNLCVKCSNEVFVPDENGGCVGAKKCEVSKNYCIKCDDSSTLCENCEQGYFPDENGACSYIPNCEISSKGECLKCIENYILIGKKNDLKLCKYLYSDDLLNCKMINNESGKCILCEENYYLNEKDKKCINIENCAESVYGICKKCINGYYLDKSDEKCKIITPFLLNCKVSLDGEKCDECDDDYFLSQEGKCTEVNFCSKVNENYNQFCDECIDGYFLSQDKACSQEQNCALSDKITGICLWCNNNYYLNSSDGKCYTNTEENNFKYCAKISLDGDCLECIFGKELGDDKKCSNTKYCIKSENGLCVSCQDNFYLSKDNNCTNTEHCLNSRYNYCVECENNYYLDRTKYQCSEISENFINCLASDFDGIYCGDCKENYYLSGLDKKCYSNQEKNNFYQCKYSNNEGTYCNICNEGYVLNSKDFLCGKIKHCAVQENENKCSECDENYCLDLSKGTCENNQIPPKEENKKIYFKCNKTNEEGTECEECLENYDLTNGICVNNFDCKKKENDVCLECTELKENGFEICINKEFGCVETYAYDCLVCENSLDFDTCTQCKDGFKLDEYNYCEKSE